MRISKKILAGVLAALMAISMMPFTVLADTDVLPTVTATDTTAEGYDTAYEYTYANDGDAKYVNYYGDITVSFDRAIEADDVVLAGRYNTAYNGGNWNVVPLRALAANEEFRIVKDGLVGQAVTFAQLIFITSGDFFCAAKGVDVAGVTMTVKFNLYETKTSTDAIEIASGTKTYTFPEANDVAEVNGTKYDTLEAAIAAANAGDKITLLDDVVTDTPIVVPADKDIKLDLNGHSISGNIADSDGKKLIQVSGTLEFVGQNGGCIYNTNTAGQGHAACQALSGGTVIVSAPITFGDSDEIRDNANNTNRGCGIQNNGGTLIINDGYYTAIDANYSTGAWAYAILNVEGDTTINNATVYGNALHGALGCEGGTLTVNDGTFAVNGANNYYSLYADGGEIIVNGGTFTDNSKYGVNYVGTDSEINISGGTFTYSSTTPFVQKSSKSNPVVSGGTFSDDVTDYLVEGATQDVNGAVAQAYVAKIGSTYYATLEDAAASANAGETITLVADVDLTTDARYPAPATSGVTDKDDSCIINLDGVTLDLNGKTITNNSCGAFFSGSNATIKNGNIVSVPDSYGREYGLALWSEAFFSDDEKDINYNVVLEDLDVTGAINVVGHRNVVLRNCDVHGADKYYAVYLNWGSDVTIESGSYSSNTDNTVGNANYASYGDMYKSELNIKGGEFDVKKNLVLSSSGPVIISGGIYTKSGVPYLVPEKYIADGYIEDMTTGEVVLNNATNTMSITVEDNIDLNIYVADPANVIKTVEYTYNGSPNLEENNEVTKTVKAKKNEEGKIPLKVELAPAQIMDQITVVAKNAAGEAVDSFDTSIGEYCNAIIEGTGFTSDMKDLAKSTLDYGKAASEYFNYNTTAFSGYTTQLADPTDAIRALAQDATKLSYADGNFRIESVTYVATSTPELRFYIAEDSASEDYLVSCNEGLTSNIGTAKFVKTVDEYGHKKMMLQIKGIDIVDFNKEIAVKWEGRDFDLLNFTPIVWVNAAIKKTGTPLGELGKAIGNYYLKSVAYFGE